MATEPFDMWVHPFSEEIGKKLKPIKHSIQRLKEAHDTETNQQREALLSTQRYLANFIVISTANHISSMIHNQKPDIFLSFSPQLTAELGRAQSKIATSQDPLPTATEFTLSSNTV